MILDERKYDLNGHELVLRSPNKDDAEELLKFIKTVTGETRFLMCEADEMNLTMEEELDFINGFLDSDDNMFFISLLDGEHVGNCSFSKIKGSRRNAHRASLGIALYQKFTGMGIGTIMLNVLLEEIEKHGYEQAELIVIGKNVHAQHMYEKAGFEVVGRHPNANKYDDGTYDDDVIMVKSFT